MERVDVELIKKSEELLEQECFPYFSQGIKRKKETLHDVAVSMNKMNTKGLVDHILTEVWDWARFLSARGSDPGKHQLPMSIGLYYSGDLYEKDNLSDYIIENSIRPIIEDIAVIDFGYDVNDFFVVHFSEFINLLSVNGYELEGVQSFDDIVNLVLEGKPTNVNLNCCDIADVNLRKDNIEIKK